MESVAQLVIATRKLPPEPRQVLSPGEFTPVAYARDTREAEAVMFVLHDPEGVVDSDVHVYVPDVELGWYSPGGFGGGWPSAELRSYASDELGADVVTIGIGALSLPDRSDLVFHYGIAAADVSEVGGMTDAGDLLSCRPMRFGAWLIPVHSLDVDFRARRLA